MSGEKEIVFINASDASFMLRVLDLPSELRDKLESVTARARELSDDDADKLRDLCADKLQTHGFNADYDPTDVGQKLEGLIDKLFVG